MSGGVDSSAAALLLMQQGYEVTGCTMRLFGEELAGTKCGSLSGIADAKAVCDTLGIEHITADFSKCFAENVCRPFASDYIRGITPNPCVMCNKKLKFGKMLSYAIEQGFDYVATGHYAGMSYNGEKKRFELLRSPDHSKDQSYVLYNITQEQAAHILFPLYGYSKPELRVIAGQAGLVTAQKADSQDICFIPDGDHAQFIARFTGHEDKKGSFIDKDGNVLGEHGGITRYTIGQRRGLGIALGLPVFVTAKDAVSNTVTLGDESELMQSRLRLKCVNMINMEQPPMRVTAKVRYNSKDVPAALYRTEDGYIIEFDEGVRAPAAGQSCVFYDGERVVGGGIIV